MRVDATRTEPRSPPAAVVVVAAVAMLIFTVPLVGLLERAPWSDLWRELTAHETRAALRLSIVCSLWSTALAVLLGVPLAWVLARARFPGRALARALTTLPMVLPPVVGGLALLLAFARDGLVGRWLHDGLGIQLTYSTAGAVLAETFVAMPFLVVTVEAALRSMDTRYEDAAATLGARRWTVFRRVTLPMIAPSLAAGAALSWARALGEFGATIMFAGNISGRTRTMPLAVFTALETRPQGAIALSLVLLAVSLVVLVLLRHRWLGSA